MGEEMFGQLLPGGSPQRAQSNLLKGLKATSSRASAQRNAAASTCYQAALLLLLLLSLHSSRKVQMTTSQSPSPPAPRQHCPARQSWHGSVPGTFSPWWCWKHSREMLSAAEGRASHTLQEHSPGCSPEAWSFHPAMGTHLGKRHFKHSPQLPQQHSRAGVTAFVLPETPWPCQLSHL